MTVAERRKKGDLVPDREICRVLSLLRDQGVAIGAVDVRADGVTVYPATPAPGTAYDQWKTKDEVRDRAAHR